MANSNVVYCVWDSGLAFLITQFVVWEPHFNTFCRHSKIGDFAKCKQFALPELEEICCIFITCYFPWHAGPDEGYARIRLH